MKTWEQRRDEAAEKSIDRCNYPKDAWVKSQVRTCGQFSFLKGWSACREDESVKKLLEALEAYANAEDVQCRTRYLDSNGEEQLDEWDQSLARQALADWEGGGK